MYLSRPIDVYLQLDGVFWHGLDKPLEEIVSFPQVIFQFEDDHKQDAWFQIRGLKLVQITDLEWNVCYQNGNFDSITLKLGG